MVISKFYPSEGHVRSFASRNHEPQMRGPKSRHCALFYPCAAVSSGILELHIAP